jgi:hypothetical protein
MRIARSKLDSLVVMIKGLLIFFEMIVYPA